MSKPPPKLTPVLRAEYEKLFTSCKVRPERAAEVEQLTASLLANRTRYEAVATAQGVPWGFVAVVHNMESSQSFKGHLHNGDPLTARTRQVPKGRPKTGNPPFTWEASAADALSLRGLGAGKDWTLAGLLYQLEGYNGWGYRLYHPHVLSPYLWSGSQHYLQGKYVADGAWSDTAVSKQIGAAVLLRRLAEKGAVDFRDQPAPAPPAAAGAAPLIPRYSMSKPADPAQEAAAIALQTWLNTFPGVWVKPDGAAGQKTSDAYRVVTGHYLPGDPRGS